MTIIKSNKIIKRNHISEPYSYHFRKIISKRYDNAVPLGIMETNRVLVCTFSVQR